MSVKTHFYLDWYKNLFKVNLTMKHMITTLVAKELTLISKFFELTED